MTPTVAAIRAAPSWLRRRLRASEAVLILLAVAIGGAAGLLSVVQGAVARALQHLLFALPGGQRLSATPTIPLLALIALPVGGIAPELMADWRKAGAAGFGLGSALFAPGMSAADVGARAKTFIETWNAG